MAVEKPMHPHEYARKYRAWEMDMAIVEQILTCCCGACAVCCIVRPFALQAEFEDEVSNGETHINYDEIPYDEEEHPEDEYDEED